MKVVSYSNVIPPANKNLEKPEILRRYLIGVKKLNDEAVFQTTPDLIDCDVAVIQGWQHAMGKSAPHLRFREQIINDQKQKNKYVCVADSNLFLYATENNEPHHYLRYSFNGVFPTTGIYCDNAVDTTRWDQISQDLNIGLESRKTNGGNVLVCLQRHGGWSMGSINMTTWIENIVKQIRQHTDRTIVLRPHPKDNNSSAYLKNIVLDKRLKISLNKTLDDDLRKAWCVVNHNSSSVVGSIIKGYPAFITDPKNSQCREVADTDFSKIETPTEFDRLSWLQRISMFHWKFSELEDGSCWSHMKNYCQ